MFDPVPVISIVSPVYKAANIIPELVSRITQTLEPLQQPFEIILVEDGSQDGSWEAIETEANKDVRVKGIKLSRNFGQHYAITAGLEHARGKYVCVMDCDLQDDPQYLPLMIEKMKEGFDIVYTVKDKREHPALKNFSARWFFKIYNYLAEVKSHGEFVGAYSMLSRKVVDAFLKIRDVHRHYLLVLKMLGFNAYYLPVKHQRRFEGKSSYTTWRLLKHSLVGITSQSVRLLHLSIGIGFTMVVISLIWTLWILLSYFVRGAFPGYTSLMAMLLLSTGLILLSVGVAGIYIGNIFEQVKNRPLYIVDEKVNL